MRTTKHRAWLILAVLGTTMALPTVTAPVAASGRPQPVRIDETTYFYSYPFTGPFTSTGGLICRYGIAQNGPESFDFIDHEIERHIHIAVVTTFTCVDDRGTPRDEGGTFRIGRQIFIDLDARTEAFSWVVEGSGTGAYKGLRGGGAGVTDFLPDPYHISHFQGFLSN